MPLLFANRHLEYRKCIVLAKTLSDSKFIKSTSLTTSPISKEVQKAFDNKLALFLDNTTHPSLRVKRIQITKGRWEGSVTKNYRFTFEYVENTALFRTLSIF